MRSRAAATSDVVNADVSGFLCVARHLKPGENERVQFQWKSDVSLKFLDLEIGFLRSTTIRYRLSSDETGY